MFGRNGGLSIASNDTHPKTPGRGIHHAALRSPPNCLRLLATRRYCGAHWKALEQEERGYGVIDQRKLNCQGANCRSALRAWLISGALVNREKIETHFTRHR